MKSPTEPVIHIVSDSTGETAEAVVRAALARFDVPQLTLRMSVFVRAVADLEAAIDKLIDEPGIVFFTLADPGARDRLTGAAAAAGCTAVPVLDAQIAALARFLSQTPRDEAGLQHRINDAYFDRIAALDFAMSHDDGALGARLHAADVILTGVSRTSKTPTCIYLAHRGIRAANLPLVPGQAVPPSFHDARKAGVVAIGLVASPARLAQVRRQRLETLGDRTPGYAEPEQIREEVAESRLLFDRLEIPVIDVTRRAIEETAAEILAILREHRSARERGRMA